MKLFPSNHIPNFSPLKLAERETCEITDKDQKKYRHFIVQVTPKNIITNSHILLIAFNIIAGKFHFYCL